MTTGLSGPAAFARTLPGPEVTSIAPVWPEPPRAIFGADLDQRECDDRVRWEVEARLLAAQGDDEIADRMGVSARVVAAFEPCS